MINRIVGVERRRGREEEGFTPAWKARLKKNRHGTLVFPTMSTEVPAANRDDSMNIQTWGPELHQLQQEIAQAKREFDATKVPLSPATSKWLLPNFGPLATTIGPWNEAPNDTVPEHGWLVSAEALQNYVQKLSALERRRPLYQFFKYAQMIERSFDPSVREAHLVVVGGLWLIGAELPAFELRDCLMLGNVNAHSAKIQHVFLESVRVKYGTSIVQFAPQSGTFDRVRTLSKTAKSATDFFGGMNELFLQGDGELNFTSADCIATRLLRVNTPGLVFSQAKIRAFDFFDVNAEQLKAYDLKCQGRAVVDHCTIENIQLGGSELAGVRFVDSKISSFDASNAKFAASVRFGRVDFATAPNFHETIFPSNTEFHKVTFGPASGKRDSETWLSERSAYRALRVAMNKAKAIEAESNFFEREQRASRHLLEYRKAPITKTLSLIYDKVSGYGTAPGRALSAFGIWNIVFAALFCALLVLGPAIHGKKIPSLIPGYDVGFAADPPALEVEAKGSTFGGLAGVGLAVQNAINPLALATHKPMIKIQNGSLFFLSVIQSVGSAGIVTLFLLAVRNRFQRSGGSSSG
jgi:hypothetical protein